MNQDKTVTVMGIELKTKLSELFTHGTFLPTETMESLGIMPISSIMLDMVRLSNRHSLERLKFDEDHNLETFQVENKDTSKIYLQSIGMQDFHLIPPPKDYVMGVRDKVTKEVVVEPAYCDIQIIDQDTLLINGWLVVPLIYLDGTIKYINNHYQNESLNSVKPSDVIFKIVNGDYNYAIERDNAIVLIKAEEIYHVELFGYKGKDLTEMGVVDKTEFLVRARRPL